jgi:hypothetical protein
VPAQVLALATIFNTSDPAAARVQKMPCFFPNTSKAIRLCWKRLRIDAIKFTTCRRCGGTLRHFSVESDKVLCADCFLDHCDEIEKDIAAQNK